MLRSKFSKPILTVLCFAMLVCIIAVCSLLTSAESPEISGDASRLSVDKSVYLEGEPIMVSGIGTGTDWVGIYRVDAPHSIRWFYVDAARGGPGSGVAVNIREVPDVNATEPLSIPAGTYIIRLMPNDSSDTTIAIAWTTITVVEDPSDAGVVEAPVSATYTPLNNTDGFAAGTVSVKMPTDARKNRSIVMYWANEDGKLEEYTALSKFKVTGETTSFTFGNNVIIPAGATRLLVYAMNDNTGKLSEDFVTVDLPEGAAHKALENPLASLWVTSDLHLTTDQNHTYNKNFSGMLRDVGTVDPNALGIVVVGDISDSGQEAEYQNMMSLYEAATQVPPLFLAIGNHDVRGNAFEISNQLFLQYATLPDGSHPTDTSYDFWLGGYHFIFLGTDTPSDLYAEFTRNTLTWFKEKLDENRDPSRPTFVFLHQSMENTVSGSLPGEGWNGVSNEQRFRDILSDYPEVMLFNGHSHWTMDSVGNMYEGTEDLPCRIFNCASVGYLWSGYNVVTGEHLDGSQGYCVKLYDGKLYVLGRDFANGQWISSAQYCIVLAEQEETEAPTEELTQEPIEDPTEEPEEMPTEEPVEDPTEKLTEGSIEDPTEIPTDAPFEPMESSPDTDAVSDVGATSGVAGEDTVTDSTEKVDGGCGSVVSLSSLFILSVFLCAIVGIFARRKNTA